MSSNNTTNTHHSVITPDNHGSYITITSAILLIGTVLVYFLRLTVRFALGGQVGSDDYLLTAGTVWLSNMELSMRSLTRIDTRLRPIGDRDGVRQQWARTECQFNE